MASFKLADKFVEKYKKIKPPFGFNGLGEFVDLRTYSRIKDDGSNELWFEQIRRVVEGTFTMQKNHIEGLDLGWSESRAQKSAQEMYDRMFYMKFTAPGRGMWAMGSPLTEERGLYAALNNCGFASTQYIDKELAEPFTFLMDASMLGIGVGFDVHGAGKLDIQVPGRSASMRVGVDTHLDFGVAQTHVIADSREGWVESVKLLIESYFVASKPSWVFDYSQIRVANLPIKGFGGVSSGPAPLISLHDSIRAVFDPLADQPITQRAIADVMNLIGVCVVAGNVRRTAEIMFGSPYSEEYLSLKDYKWDSEQGKYVGAMAERAPYGWTSNNSVYADIGMDYSRVAEMTHNNGEPGYMWLENAKNYGRMADAPDYKDKRVMGANPCVEQSLEHMELCCLVETYPARHESLEDFKRTLKFAYMYAKTVTLGKTHWQKTNRVLLRNRRIGTSMSGIQQFIAKKGLNEFKQWCEVGYQTIQRYDKVYSEWLAVPRSIKTTSIKPSGTVSLLAGATPGMHWPESRFYIRRVRVSKTSPYVDRFKSANYIVEDCVGDISSVVVEFPVAIEEEMKTVSEVSIWEQFAMAAFLQKYWADNQVSCTVTFDPDTVSSSEIAKCLDYFQYDLKGISLLPKVKAGAYAQMPYEEITEKQYYVMLASLLPLNLMGVQEEAVPEVGCNNDSCMLPGAA